MLTVIVLLTATGTAIALLRQGNGNSDAGGSAGLSAAAAVRAQAARWISREISRNAVVGCDAVMCSALSNAGVPPSVVQELGPTAPDPLGVNVIVATEVLRSQFGTRLASEYAPQVLATFGHGAQRVDIRLVAPYGAAAYMTASRQALATRKQVGTELLGNSQIIMPSAARGYLAAGSVDPRILDMLPVLARLHPIRVLGFYNDAPGADPAVPLSAVRLAGAVPQAGISATAYLHWLLSFLEQQRPPYRPASISTISVDGQVAVAVRFDWPDPIGLPNQ